MMFATRSAVLLQVKHVNIFQSSMVKSCPTLWPNLSWIIPKLCVLVVLDFRLLHFVAFPICVQVPCLVVGV